MELNNVEIKWLGHASFEVIDKKTKKVLYIDPFQLTADNPADLILITHAHYDHCSVEDIKKILKPETVIYSVADTLSKLAGLECKDVKIVEPMNEYEESWIKIKTVPAYNKNKSFHPKENSWVGYVVEINGLRIYHAGDTDVIPEMSELNGKVDIALLPIGGTYTMNAEEAAEACRIIRPKMVIPMHYGTIVGTNADLELFKKKAQTFCEVRIA